MNERLVTYSIDAKPNDTVALGAGGYVFTLPYSATLVHVSTRANADDSSASIDIQDDGTDVVTGVDASDASAPGTWISTHFGGSNDPVHFAALSVVDIDYNSHAVGVGNNTILTFLVGI